MMLHPTATQALADAGVSLGLGLVIYLRGSLGERCGRAAQLWHLFSTSQFGKDLCLIRTGDQVQWTPLSRDTLARALWHLASPQKQRVYLQVQAVDREGAPELVCELADVTPTRSTERASWLFFQLPCTTAPNVVLSLAKRVAEDLPLWWGSGGYLLRAPPAERDHAYNLIWATTKRFWSLEIADPVLGTWDAPAGLCTTNWLTLLGNDLVAERMPGLAETQLPAPLAIDRAREAVVVRTGERPLLGDINRFEDISAYEIAAEFLIPFANPAPRPFPGRFRETDSTLAWSRRFVAPDDWIAAAVG